MKYYTPILKLFLAVAVGNLCVSEVQARLDVPPAAPPAATDGAKVFERVTFEMSLKPFRSMEPKAVRAVCVNLFRQWEPMTRRAGSCAVMLWTADGSEILDYQGQLEDEIQAAQYIPAFRNWRTQSHNATASQPLPISPTVAATSGPN